MARQMMVRNAAPQETPERHAIKTGLNTYQANKNSWRREKKQVNKHSQDARQNLLHLKLRSRKGRVGVMRVIELPAPIPDMC